MSRYFEMIDGEVYLTFGYHKGEVLHEVADDDQEYLVWILREFARGKGFDEELAVEIEEELKSRGVDISEVV